MKNIIIFLFLLVLMLLLTVICIVNNANPSEIEQFLVKNNDPNNDGKMRFGYLTNRNYANSILSRYYINDDKKIGGIRMVSHPYQIRYSPNGRDKYYGTLFWDKLRSDNIYKTTGIRL